MAQLVELVNTDSLPADRAERWSKYTAAAVAALAEMDRRTAMLRVVPARKGAAAGGARAAAPDPGGAGSRRTSCNSLVPSPRSAHSSPEPRPPPSPRLRVLPSPHCPSAPSTPLVDARPNGAPELRAQGALLEDFEEGDEAARLQDEWYQWFAAMTQAEAADEGAGDDGLQLPLVFVG